MQTCAVLCCAVLCCAVLCCAVLCCSKKQRLNSACPFSEASSSCKIQPRQHLDHEVMLVSHTLHLFLYSCSTVQQSLPTNAEKTVDGQELLRWSSAFWEPPEQGKTLGAQAASVEAQLQLYSCSRACTNAARATVPCVAWLSKGETPRALGERRRGRVGAAPKAHRRLQFTLLQKVVNLQDQLQRPGLNIGADQRCHVQL